MCPSVGLSVRGFVPCYPNKNKRLYFRSLKSIRYVVPSIVFLTVHFSIRNTFFKASASLLLNVSWRTCFQETASSNPFIRLQSLFISTGIGAYRNKVDKIDDAKEDEMKKCNHFYHDRIKICNHITWRNELKLLALIIMKIFGN